MVGTSIEAVEAVATPYVFILAIVGPVLARFSGGGARPMRGKPAPGPATTT
jgi:monovalent cation:H+ antiporter-2, CPA2 family